MTAYVYQDTKTCLQHTNSWLDYRCQHSPPDRRDRCGKYWCQCKQFRHSSEHLSRNSPESCSPSDALRPKPYLEPSIVQEVFASAGWTDRITPSILIAWFKVRTCSGLSSNQIAVTTKHQPRLIPGLHKTGEVVTP